MSCSRKTKMNIVRWRMWDASKSHILREQKEVGEVMFPKELSVLSILPVLVKDIWMGQSRRKRYLGDRYTAGADGQN